MPNNKERMFDRLHSTGDATVDDIKIVRQVAPNCKIKAVGGIRTAQKALIMLNAGAERIGTFPAFR